MTEIVSASEFNKVYTGKFFGVLRWPQLDTLWEIVKKDNTDWFIYAVGSEPPQEAAIDEKVDQFIDEIDKLLRQEHDEDYCGIVYTDSLDKPSLIKVFDPNNLGTSCSIAKKGPLPSWVISKMKPDDLLAAMTQPANRRRWWQKIFT